MRATMLKQGGKEKLTAGGTGRNFNTSVLINYDSTWRWVMVYILVSMEGRTCRRRRKRENGEKGRQNFMIDIIVCFTLCSHQREWNTLFLPRNRSRLGRLPKNKGKSNKERKPGTSLSHERCFLFFLPPSLPSFSSPSHLPSLLLFFFFVLLKWI